MLQVLQIDSIVLDTHQLVHHGLVRPLVEQRGDRILLPIADEHVSRRRVTRHSIDKLALLAQLLLRLLGDVPAERAVRLVAQYRIGACRHNHTEQAIYDSIRRDLVLLCPLVGRVQAQTQSAANIQTE